MRKFGLISIIALSFSFILLTNSCDLNDGYSSGDFWISRATVDSIDNQTFSLVLDDNTKLWIAASNFYNYHPKNKQRLLVDYTILSDKHGEYDHYVKLNDFREILTKNIATLTSENEGEFGNDPVKIFEIDTDGGYLNILFGYNYGGTKRHFINLVHNSSVQNPEDGKVYLEFRHNAYDDPENVGVKGLVSFNLESLKIQDKSSVDIVVKVKGFNEDKTFNLVYKYGSDAVPASALNLKNFGSLSGEIK